jgi:hypothetical protein
MLHPVTDFDGDLQMFREAPQAVKVAHLRFLRWLVEHERLDRPTAGPPSGDFAQDPLPEGRVPESLGPARGRCG